MNSTDIIILAGGKGTRLASIVPDRPKPLALVNGEPFLDILIRALRESGANRIILAVGYMREQIISRYQGQPGIYIVVEESPLGTGGGLKNAASAVQSSNVLVMNGDSYIEGGVNLDAFRQFHEDRGASFTMMLAKPREEKDYGVVCIDDESRVTAFNEKTSDVPAGAHYLNAGVYMMKRQVFDRMPAGMFSLETDFFPKFAPEEFYGWITHGHVIDIGTPARYERAQKVSFKGFND